MPRMLARQCGEPLRGKAPLAFEMIRNSSKIHSRAVGQHACGRGFKVVTTKDLHSGFNKFLTCPLSRMLFRARVSLSLPSLELLSVRTLEVEFSHSYE